MVLIGCLATLAPALYEMADVGETLTKAKASGASVLVDPFTADQREAAFVQFPGGTIAEIHASVR